MFAKVKIIITNQNHTNFIIIVKSWLYNEEGQIDLQKVPLEIIIELIISFLLIICGSLFEYVHLDIYYILMLQKYLNNIQGNNYYKNFAYDL